MQFICYCVCVCVCALACWHFVLRCVVFALPLLLVLDSQPPKNVATQLKATTLIYPTQRVPIQPLPPPTRLLCMQLQTRQIRFLFFFFFFVYFLWVATKCESSWMSVQTIYGSSTMHSVQCGMYLNVASFACPWVHDGSQHVAQFSLSLAQLLQFN